MLLKILTIAVIAWFVVRAARNLLRAVIHDQGIRESRGGPDTRRSDRETIIHRRTDTIDNSAERRDEENVEDARFRDI